MVKAKLYLSEPKFIITRSWNTKVGQFVLPEDILISSFVDSLSVVECELLKSCLTDTKFSTHSTNKLIDLLSRFGLRKVPKPSSSRTQILQVARFEMKTKPISAH